MVFDNFTKGITDVTSKVTDTVTSPIIAVKNSVSKTVLWPKLDLVDHAVDTLKAKELQASYKKELTRRVSLMKKSRVSTQKLTACKKALAWYVFAWETYAEIRKNMEEFIYAVKKQFQNGFQVIEQKSWVPTLVKSKKWTATEQEKVLDGIEELQSTMETAWKTIGASLSAYYVAPLKTKVDQKELMNKTKDELESNHDASLDASVSLSSSWRKYINILRVIEKDMKTIKSLKDRKVKALPTEKKHFDTKIKELNDKAKSLLAKEGKGLLSDIAKSEKDIVETYKKEQTILNTFSATYAELQSGLFQWQTTNSKKTAATTKTWVSSRKSLEKSSIAWKKQDETAYKRIENAVKKPYTNTQWFIKVRDGQVTTHNKYMNIFADHAMTSVDQLTQLEKDIAVKERIINEHHTFIYNDSVLLRISVLFVWFANRYHKRHASLAKEAWNKLLDLKRSDSKLFASYTKEMQKKAETYNGWIKANEKRSREDKATVDGFKKKLRQIVRLLSVVDYEKSWIKAAKEGKTVPAHAKTLVSVHKSMKEHKKRLTKVSSEIEGAIQKTKVTMNDKEKSLDIKSTRALKKEVDTLHKQKEDQEVYLDLFNHYKEDISMHLEQTTDLRKGYEKSGKKSLNTMKRYEKLIKSMMTKLWKTTLLKEVKWTSVLADSAAKI